MWLCLTLTRGFAGHVWFPIAKSENTPRASNKIIVHGPLNKISRGSMPLDPLANLFQNEAFPCFPHIQSLILIFPMKIAILIFFGDQGFRSQLFLLAKKTVLIQTGQTSRCGVSMVLYGLIKLHYQ